MQNKVRTILKIWHRQQKLRTLVFLGTSSLGSAKETQNYVTLIGNGIAGVTGKNNFEDRT